MYCNPVGQSYDPENTIIEFCDLSPKANPRIILNFDPDRILNNFNAPLPLNVRTLTQNFILKISSVLVLCHDSIICRSERVTRV